MKEPPKFKQLLWNDYTLFGSLVSGILFLGIAIYLFFSEPNINYFYIFGTLIILMIGLFIYRTIALYDLFRHGIPTEATITGLFHYRGQVRVGLSYRYEDFDYHSYTIVKSNRNSRRLHKGMIESVLIHPKNKKRVIIISMFQ